MERRSTLTRPGGAAVPGTGLHPVWLVSSTARASRVVPKQQHVAGAGALRRRIPAVGGRSSARTFEQTRVSLQHPYSWMPKNLWRHHLGGCVHRSATEAFRGPQRCWANVSAARLAGRPEVGTHPTEARTSAKASAERQNSGRTRSTAAHPVARTSATRQAAVAATALGSSTTTPTTPGRTKCRHLLDSRGEVRDMPVGTLARSKKNESCEGIYGGST